MTRRLSPPGQPWSGPADDDRQLPFRTRRARVLQFGVGTYDSETLSRRAADPVATIIDERSRAQGGDDEWGASDATARARAPAPHRHDRAGPRGHADPRSRGDQDRQA